ncbi:4-hydroxy-tetrahydrodipicolinate reductase [Herbiconiux solani]|uniref:4-hydroxy-tetrahydrodipicolinate reductase n=1 Tax=Herbiconiux solani TaxID=661329 RepID=UPI00082482D0|nr:4-hydroxy-tetrahydrodipicolinate reductase [Herbiconiux solani]
MTTKVAVVGATGKMGRLFSELIDGAPDFELVAGLDSRSDLSEMLPADLVVDVTVPGVSGSVVEYAVAHNRNVLIGTSGWSAERITALARTLGDPPASGVVVIPNFSIGSVLATSFAAMAAPFFDSIEIVEAHASTKVDSPSGTAVRTAELMSAARAALGPVSAPHTDQRARGQQVASIPIHSLRLNGVVAKQDVVLGGTGEVLTLTHETISPQAYAAGILVALRAAVGQRGVVVGLDRLIDLSGREAATGAAESRSSRTGTAAASGPDGDDAPENVSGQAATATSVS